jgi:hypothetical protein
LLRCARAIDHRDPIAATLRRCVREHHCQFFSTRLHALGQEAQKGEEDPVLPRGTDDHRRQEQKETEKILKR